MPLVYSTAAASPATRAPGRYTNAAIEAKTSGLHPIAIRNTSAASERTPLLGAESTAADLALRRSTRSSAIIMAVARSAYVTRDRTSGLHLGISADTIGASHDTSVADDACNLVSGLLVQLQTDLRKTVPNCELGRSEGSAGADSRSALTLRIPAGQLNTSTLRALAKAVERRRLQYQLGSGEQEGGPSDVFLYRVLSCSGIKELVSVDPKKLRDWFQQSYERGERLVRSVSAPRPDPS